MLGLAIGCYLFGVVLGMMAGAEYSELQGKMIMALALVDGVGEDAVLDALGGPDRTFTVEHLYEVLADKSEEAAWLQVACMVAAMASIAVSIWTARRAGPLGGGEGGRREGQAKA